MLLPKQQLDAPLVDENLRIGGWDVFGISEDQAATVKRQRDLHRLVDRAKGDPEGAELYVDVEVDAHSATPENPADAAAPNSAPWNHRQRATPQS